MDYFSFGGGKKGLVILPGASLKSIVLSADAVAAAYACFADEYTVYVFDCSSGWQEGCTVEGAAKNTAEAMKQLGIEKAHLFGCSLGGMIAQYVAINNPELVHKLVLGSTLSRHNEDSLKTCTEWCRLADAGDTVGLNRKMAEQVYSEEFRERFRDAFAAMETVGTIEELKQFSVMIRACIDMNAYDRLDAVTCPTLVIGSYADKTLFPQGSIELAEKLGCELYMYSGYSHAVYDEAPDYREHLLDFFNK